MSESNVSTGAAESASSTGSEGLAVSEELNAVVGEDSEQAEEEVEASEEGSEESKEEVEEELEKASKEEVEKAKQSLKKKYKLKVDGEELEEELSDEDIVRELQLAKKARKEIQNSTNLKKEVESFLETLRKNPAAVLSDPLIGLDPIEFAQQILSQKLEEEAKDPATREKEKLEQELQQLREQMKSEEERIQRETYEREVIRAEQELEEQVSEALETSGLPKSPYVVKKMAEVMISAMERKMNISPKQAMNIVKKEMTSDIKELFNASPDDLLEQLIGSDNIKRLNKKSLARIKKVAPTANSIKPTGQMTKTDTNTQKEEKINISDWLRRK